VTTQFLKQPGDPTWASDSEVIAYKEFLKKYTPLANPDDYSVLVAYMNVHAVALALGKCGDQLTRDNLNSPSDVAPRQEAADDASGHFDQRESGRLHAVQGPADCDVQRDQLDSDRRSAIGRMITWCCARSVAHCTILKNGHLQAEFAYAARLFNDPLLSKELRFPRPYDAQQTTLSQAAAIF
jgi:hypothetical protein